MAFEFPDLKPLLMIGGCSSRMCTPKHLLLDIDNQPALMRTLQVLWIACPEAEQVYVSVRSKTQEVEFLSVYSDCTIPIRFIFDKDAEGDSPSIGPADGLLAAHREASKSHWLVVACDYPLLDPMAFHQRLSEFEEPVTCFKNSEGYCEPLLGIWRPSAWRSLNGMFIQAEQNRVWVLRQLYRKTISPAVEMWLMNEYDRGVG